MLELRQVSCRLKTADGLDKVASVLGTQKKRKTGNSVHAMFVKGRAMAYAMLSGTQAVQGAARTPTAF